MEKQAWRFLPKTCLGKWSIGLIVGMLLLFFLGMSFVDWLYESIPAGSTILEDIFSRPALALSMLSGMIAGISAFVTGLLAIIRKKDHALLVYLSSLIGALLIVFLIMEFLFPH